MKKEYCPICETEHELMAFCRWCGACLYKHSTQVYDAEFPLFSCDECGTINFWD